MPDLVTQQPLPWLLAIVCVIWLVGLWLGGAFIDHRVELFRQAARRRGLNVGANLTPALGMRGPRRLDARQLLDLRRVMLLAGRMESVGSYVSQSWALALLAIAVLSGLDALPAVLGGSMPVALYVPVVVGLGLGAVRILDLYSRAARRQVALDRAIADIPSLLAILVSARSMPFPDAVSMIAKLQVDPILAEVLQPAYWRRLIAATPETRSLLSQLTGQFAAADLYMALGVALGSANMRELGVAAKRILETGEPARRVCLELAKQLQAQQIHASEVAVVRAEKVSVVPMVGMLLAIFAVIGPAIFFQMMQALS